MKKMFLLLIMLLLNKYCFCQTFTSLPPGFGNSVRSLFIDSISNILYAGGEFDNFSNGGTVFHVAQWNGSQWNSLGAGVLGNVYSIAKFNSEIYVGGNFPIAGTVTAYGLSRWDGFSWDVPGGNANLPQWSVVWDLNVIDNELYVFGNYDSINNLPANGMSKFDGQNWSIFPPIDPLGSFHASELYNGELYIGGNFDGGSGLQDIAKFDGTNWVTVGGGLSGPLSDITDMIIFQNKLFVVGNLLVGQGDPGNGIAIWDGINWSQAGSGLMPSTVSAIHEFQGELYAAGAILNAGGVPVTYIAKWNGTTWNNIGANFDNKPGCFASFNNDLYIGGGFITVNGDSMHRITKYTNPVGIDDHNSTIHIDIYPNPTSETITITGLNANSNKRQLIKLNDMTGRTIIIQSLNTDIETQEINISSLSSGSYILSIESEGINVLNKKVMITK